MQNQFWQALYANIHYICHKPCNSCISNCIMTAEYAICQTIATQTIIWLQQSNAKISLQNPQYNLTYNNTHNSQPIPQKSQKKSPPSLTQHNQLYPIPIQPLPPLDHTPWVICSIFLISYTLTWPQQYRKRPRICQAINFHVPESRSMLANQSTLIPKDNLVCKKTP